MEPLCLSQVDGFLVGQAEDRAARTGCTAVLTPAGATASVFTPGFAPGSRETEMLRPDSAPQVLHGLLLAGGSAFGLAAAAGLVRFLREGGFGLATGAIRVPLVAGAVIYDYPGNLSGGQKPDEALGYEAARTAGRAPLTGGPVGAGLSARSGKLAGADLSSPSGLGSCGLAKDGLQLAALAVVNPLGSIIDPESGAILSGVRRADGQLADRREILGLLSNSAGRLTADQGGQTVLVAVGTNARLDKLGAFRLARMASAGIARAVYPAHLLYDGDTVFALTSNTGPEVELNWLGALAADVVSRAIADSVRSVRGADFGTP